MTPTSRAGVWAILALMAIATPAQAQSTAYLNGLQDRATYENWFSGLDADTSTGANYWAGQRSLASPGGCGQTDSSQDTGCRSAKLYLTPMDVRRLREPDYRLGWNAYRPATAVAPRTAPVAVPVAEPASPEPANVQSTVKHCIGIVHHTPASALGSWNQNFDAYAVPKPDGSTSVHHNAGHVGDQDALFVFNKCMAEQGFPLNYN